MKEDWWEVWKKSESNRCIDSKDRLDRMIQLHKLIKVCCKMKSNVSCAHKMTTEPQWEEATADSTLSELADEKMCDKTINTCSWDETMT